jgi:HK97 family phage major capsid protein/HK97 family phage prohead protease
VPSPERPPKDNIVRALFPAVELRASDDIDPNAMPAMVGRFAVFNEWTEIDSIFEGRFLERIAPGAFKKTFAENRDNIRVLFQHGQDPQVGDKPLGPIEELREEADGAHYDVSLLDTSYNRDLLPALKAGLYGASFRFRVIKEDFDRKPKRTQRNPDSLPERTIKEAEVMEFGPVTFPAYNGATAGVRSMTDAYALGVIQRASPDQLRALIEVVRPTALPHDGAGETHSAEGSRTEPPPPTPVQSTDPAEAGSSASRSTPPVKTIEELRARDDEIKARLQDIHAEFGAEQLPDEVRVEFDGLVEERDGVQSRMADYEARNFIVSSFARDETRTVDVGQATRVAVRPERRLTPENIWAVEEYRSFAGSQEQLRHSLRDGAMRAAEVSQYPHEQANKPAVQAHIERILQSDDEYGKIAQRMLATGSPVYHRAFAKSLAGQWLNPDEQRAMSLTGAAGGFAVPFQLDPTIIPTSNGAVNPLRAISRVIPITTDEWRGVSSGAITAAYQAEASETTDNSPTLVQPTISTEKAQAFIPFSIEVGMDWGGLQSEMARLLQDAKDELESAKFTSGTGTNEPFGVLTGTTNTVAAATGQTFTLANLYALVAALPPRYRPRASFAGALAVINRIRQFDTSGGAALWETLANDAPSRLLGKPFYENSDMADVATNVKFLLYGDFSRFVIVERIGLDVEVIPHLVGTNHRPTGQRGLYAYWRNGSKVVDANAFRALLGTA